MPEGTQSAVVRQPPVVESESATTDHEHNASGAAPVVVPLVIVAFLALVSFFSFSAIASAVASYYKAQAGTTDFGYEYYLDDDFYPYYLDSPGW